MKMFILMFLLRLIKSELMVVIIVYIVYKILVWNVEYKKILIFIDNKKWICCLWSYVLLVMFILLINVLNYIN